MNPDDLKEFLKTCDLTKKLSEKEIDELLPFIEDKFLEPGQIVFKEGETNRELYIVKKGALEVYKPIEGHEEEQALNTLSEGDFFGEMAHLENEKRSASVRASGPGELLALHLDDLEKDKSKDVLYAKILGELGRRVSRNLRRTDMTLIESLKERLKFMQAYNQISKSIIYIVVLVAVWFNINVIIQFFPTYRETLDAIFTAVLLLVFALAVFYIIRSSGYPLSFYGLTLNNWFKVSVEAVVYSLPIMVFFLILKWFAVTEFDLFKGIPIFATESRLKEMALLTVIYVVMAPVQEFIARGGTQSMFRNFFQGENRVFLAILISNLLFQMVHTVKDFWVALASLFVGFFWGYLFEKQKSLIGVCVSHALIGAWNFYILDFDLLFKIAAAARG